MKFRYILEQKDLYQVLKETGYIKTVGKRAVLETGILSILFIGFLICFFVTKDFRNLFFAVISLSSPSPPCGLERQVLVPFGRTTTQRNSLPPTLHGA